MRRCCKQGQVATAATWNAQPRCGGGAPLTACSVHMCPAPVPLQSAAEKGGRRGGQGKSRVPSGSTVEEECRQTEDASSLYSLCVRLQATSLQA